MITGASGQGRARIGRLLPLVLRRILLWSLNLLFLAFFLFPFYVQTITALKSPPEVEATPVRWLPGQLYWGNFRAVLANGGYLHAILNSVVVATTSTALALALAAGAAYALAYLPLPRRRSLLLALVIAWTIPPIALVPALFLEMRHLGWLDTYPALITADLAIALPFAVWVLTNTFRTIPGHLVEQAEVDGCTPLLALWRVVLPLAAPGLVAAGLLSFITVWNEFLFALNLTMTAHSYTVPLAILEFGGSWGALAAASELVTVPIIVLALLGQRGIIQGLTSGAIR